MKKFKLNDFILYEQSPNQVVVQHVKGILEIDDEQMVKFLQYLNQHKVSVLDQVTFTDFFRQYSMQAIEFLLSHQLIEEISEPTLPVKQVKFASNHQDINDYMKEVMKEYEDQVDSEMVSFTTMRDNIHSYQGLNVIFLNPYTKRGAKYFRDQLANDAYLLTCYVYNGCFYIDAVYRKRLKTPCHLCHMSYIESEIRKERGVELTYQDLIDSLYHEDDHFPVETPLLKRHIINIVDKISMKLDQLFNGANDQLQFQKHFRESFKMELASRRMYTDQSFHWELCDCYE